MTTSRTLIEVNASGGSDKDGKTDEDGDGEDYSEGNYLHYRCDMCYRSFSQLSLLKQHHESHVGQVVYECTECDKAFAFLHLLEEHQLTHIGRDHILNIYI
uniref:C2H2-type domain-containing protein n=1 Tax=Gadus morhua TaxID=8049 RepID=A0A8C5FTR0_GADMO